MLTVTRRLALLLAGASALAACAADQSRDPLGGAAPVGTIETAPAPVSLQGVPVPSLVGEVAIPHSGFTLANGLKVLVHEDHKAPVVGLSIWYNVGSKDEPRGKTGFAHLFEHLMFNGSENLPGDFFTYLQQIGATDYNGTTSFDRTNYFQTVPTGALDRALFMESDRMGYLLGAVTQGNLDNQRGVVQNEKRQGDNAPGGLVFYEVLHNLFPAGHPYQHTTIGSMADLDAASLADVKQWFRDRYAPNNAVLVLAGDVTAAQARPMVEKYFGSIARGPVNNPAQAAVPTLAAAKSLVMKDRVATTTVSRYWTVPGLLDRQMVALDVGGSALGGLASSRFDKILVKGEQLAVAASAQMYALHRVGIFFVQAQVKPGIDPALVEKRLDELVAQYIAEGPTEEEVSRAAMSEVSSRIRGLEQVGGFGGKAVTLAEGQTYANDSDFYKKTLATYASVTPAEVRSAMQQWLTRPPLSVRLEPGDRPPYEDAKAIAKKTAAKASPPVVGKRRDIPPLGSLTALDFPDIVHTRLANGIPVDYAFRAAVPVTQLAMSFNAGQAADTPATRGVQALTLSMLDEGTGALDSQAFAEAQERLGVQIGASGSLDRSTVIMSALSANLVPSLDLLGQAVKAPSFSPAELERLRTQTLTAIAQMKKDPNGIASRALPALLYGASHPYAAVPGGDVTALTAATRADLLAFKDRWLRPDNVKLFVVSDRPVAELLPLLNAQFGAWEAPAGVAKGVKSFVAAPVRPASSRIVLIDRPGSPQSVISGGQITPVDPRGDVLALDSANDILGGNFLSRINMDLREAKGWSYGVRGSLSLNEKSVPYIISAPVQADRTADAILALNQQVSAFLGARGVTGEELTRTVANNINELPGRFETSAAVLSAMMSSDLLGRPDDYYETLAGKYRGQTAAALDSAIRGAVDPRSFVWVVVGDAAKVRPQLEKLKMPIEVIEVR